eukprot:6200840-Pleurochrysis_carterae.AAC.1
MARNDRNGVKRIRGAPRIVAGIARARIRGKLFGGGRKGAFRWIPRKRSYGKVLTSEHRMLGLVHLVRSAYGVLHGLLRCSLLSGARFPFRVELERDGAARGLGRAPAVETGAFRRGGERTG